MIDLHVHSNISDGSLAAEEIIKLAVGKGIRHIAITDHDTTKGLDEAVFIGRESGIEVIPGIEISAYDYRNDKKAHILGLYIEPGHPALEELCRPLAEKRHSSSKEMITRIIRLGYDITWPEAERYAQGGTGVYKQHIMHALLAKGYCDGIYGELYKKLFKTDKTTGMQGPAYIQLQYIDVVDAIKAVKSAGGIAVLAHPGQSRNFDSIREWVKQGLDGIEAFHPDHCKEDVQSSLDAAERYDLVITGGSDFHGFYGERPVELGCSELGEECILELLARKQVMGR